MGFWEPGIRQEEWGGAGGSLGCAGVRGKGGTEISHAVRNHLTSLFYIGVVGFFKNYFVPLLRNLSKQAKMVWGFC